MDEDNNIQTALNHILEERHNRAAEMGRNAQALRDAIERLESLENAKQRANVPGADREKMENILFGGEATRQQFRNLTEKLDDCKKVLRKAAESYQTLETQFNRKTVNLAVLGHMGCGKSRFLQSVSGLDNSYIPSGNGPSCTGATCIIENVNSDSTRVLLSFKNREMVTQDIKAEITRFWKKFAPRNGTPVPEFEELDRAKLSAIYAELEAAWQERPVYLRQYGGVKDEDEWEQSKRIYVEKWDEWFPLVRPNGDESEWSRGVEQRYQLKAVAFDGNTWFELPDHNRIRQFAAKFSGAKGDGPALETHSYHVATEVLLIQKRFTGIFAENLRLIDTVGIDDPAGETRIRMKKALDIGVSDGIIYIDKYTDGRSPDLNEYKTLVETLKERQMKNSKAGYSMALMMNVDSDHPFQDAWIANYFDPNVKAWDRVQGLGERADDVHTASAAPLQDDMNKIYRAAPDLFGDEGVQTTIAVNPTTQPMRVIDFLNDFLSKISRYPGDEEHIANAAEESRHAYEMLEELSNGMRTVRDKLFAANMRKNSSAEIVSQYMRPKLSRLESALVSYRDSLRTLEDMPTPLETHVRNIQLLADGESVEGYSIANIVEEFAKQYPADSDLRNLRAMDQLYLHVRQISDVPPLNYREAEAKHKSFIAETFVKELGIDLEKLGDGTWKTTDADFFQKMNHLLFSSSPDLLALSQFFTSFDAFHLNDSSTVAKAIIHHLAARKLSRREREFSGNPGQRAYATSGTPDAAFSQQEQTLISRFRPRNSGDSRDARTAPETALQEQPTEYLMSENEKRLIQSLRDALSEMLSELRDNYFEDSREKYAIRATDQLREEIMNFTMSVDEYYRDRWVSVFEFLYRCHAILNEELAAEEKLSLQRMEVLSQMNKYLEIRE